MTVDGKAIRLTAEKDPAALKWNEVGAEVGHADRHIVVVRKLIEMCLSPIAHPAEGHHRFVHIDLLT